MIFSSEITVPCATDSATSGVTELVTSTDSLTLPNSSRMVTCAACATWSRTVSSRKVLKPGASTEMVYRPGASSGKTKRPSLSLSRVRAWAVALLVSVILALATAALDPSRTKPDKEAVSV